MPDGLYELRTGSDTTLRQIAAEVLGTIVEKIKIVTADTHYTPFDAGSYASATTFITGQAVNLAAQKLRSHLLKIASQTMEVNSDKLELSEDRVSHDSTRLTLPELATISYPTRTIIISRIITYKRSRFSYLCLFRCRGRSRYRNRQNYCIALCGGDRYW